MTAFNNDDNILDMLSNKFGNEDKGIVAGTLPTPEELESEKDKARSAAMSLSYEGMDRPDDELVPDPEFKFRQQDFEQKSAEFSRLYEQEDQLARGLSPKTEAMRPVAPQEMVQRSALRERMGVSKPRPRSLTDGEYDAAISKHYNRDPYKRMGTFADPKKREAMGLAPTPEAPEIERGYADIVGSAILQGIYNSGEEVGGYILSAGALGEKVFGENSIASSIMDYGMQVVESAKIASYQVNIDQETGMDYGRLPDNAAIDALRAAPRFLVDIGLAIGTGGSSVIARKVAGSASKYTAKQTAKRMGRAFAGFSGAQTFGLQYSDAYNEYVVNRGMSPTEAFPVMLGEALSAGASTALTSKIDGAFFFTSKAARGLAATSLPARVMRNFMLGAGAEGFQEAAEQALTDAAISSIASIRDDDVRLQQIGFLNEGYMYKLYRAAAAGALLGGPAGVAIKAMQPSGQSRTPEQQEAIDKRAYFIQKALFEDEVQTREEAKQRATVEERRSDFGKLSDLDLWRAIESEFGADEQVFVGEDGDRIRVTPLMAVTELKLRGRDTGNINQETITDLMAGRGVGDARAKQRRQSAKTLIGSALSASSTDEQFNQAVDQLIANHPELAAEIALLDATGEGVSRSELNKILRENGIGKIGSSKQARARLQQALSEKQQQLDRARQVTPETVEGTPERQGVELRASQRQDIDNSISEANRIAGTDLVASEQTTPEAVVTYMQEQGLLPDGVVAEAVVERVVELRRRSEVGRKPVVPFLGATPDEVAETRGKLQEAKKTKEAKEDAIVDDGKTERAEARRQVQEDTIKEGEALEQSESEQANINGAVNRLVKIYGEEEAKRILSVLIGGMQTGKIRDAQLMAQMFFLQDRPLATGIFAEASPTPPSKADIDEAKAIWNNLVDQEVRRTPESTQAQPAKEATLAEETATFPNQSEERTRVSQDALESSLRQRLEQAGEDTSNVEVFIDDGSQPLTDAQKKVSDKAKEYGITVVYYRGVRRGFRGFHESNIPGVIAINSALTENDALVKVFYHEALHDLEIRNPGAWNRLVRDLVRHDPSLIRQKLLQYDSNYSRAYAKNKNAKISHKKLMEEAPSLMAEIVAEVLAEKDGLIEVLETNSSDADFTGMAGAFAKVMGRLGFKRAKDGKKFTKGVLALPESLMIKAEDGNMTVLQKQRLATLVGDALDTLKAERETRYPSSGPGGAEPMSVTEFMEALDERGTNRRAAPDETGLGFVKAPTNEELRTPKPNEPTSRLSLGGEYFADNDGDVTFADGSVGLFGHDEIALLKVVNETFDVMRQAMESSTEDMSRLAQELDQLDLENDPTFDDATVRSIIALARSLDKNLVPEMKRLGVTKRQLALISEPPLMGERPADYAMEVYGDIRIAGNSLTFHGISRGKMATMAKALDRIAEEQLSEDPDQIEAEVFDVEDLGSGQYWTSVPYRVIAQGNPAKLRDYRDMGRFSLDPNEFAGQLTAGAADAVMRDGIKPSGLMNRTAKHTLQEYKKVKDNLVSMFTGLSMAGHGSPQKFAGMAADAFGLNLTEAKAFAQAIRDNGGLSKNRLSDIIASVELNEDTRIPQRKVQDKDFDSPTYGMTMAGGRVFYEIDNKVYEMSARTWGQVSRQIPSMMLPGRMVQHADKNSEMVFVDGYVNDRAVANRAENTPWYEDSAVASEDAKNRLVDLVEENGLLANSASIDQALDPTSQAVFNSVTDEGGRFSLDTDMARSEEEADPEQLSMISKLNDMRRRVLALPPADEDMDEDILLDDGPDKGPKMARLFAPFLTPLHYVVMATKAGHPVREAVRNIIAKAMDMEILTQRQAAADSEAYNAMPEDWRGNKGFKFAQLVDQYVPLKEENTVLDGDTEVTYFENPGDTIGKTLKVKELPQEVQDALLYFRQESEVQRQEIVEEKRGFVRSVLARDSFDALKAAALKSEEGRPALYEDLEVDTIDGKKVFVSENRYISKDQLVEELVVQQVPSDWGRQYSHFHHAFFGKYKLKAFREDGTYVIVGDADTQAEAYEKLKNFKDSERGAEFTNYEAKPANNFDSSGESATMTQRQRNQLRKQIKSASDMESSEINAALRGVVKLKQNAKPFYAPMMQRSEVAAEGFSMDFPRVWQMQRRNFNRWKFGGLMIRQTEPLIEELRKTDPYWAEYLEQHLDRTLFNRPTKAEVVVDGVLSSLPVVGRMMGDMPTRRTLAALRSFNYLRQLKTPKQWVVNSTQPLQTVLPVVGLKTFREAAAMHNTEEGKKILEEIGYISVTSGMYLDGTESRFGTKAIELVNNGQKMLDKHILRNKISSQSEVRNMNFSALAYYLHGLKLGLSKAEAQEYARVEGYVGSQFAYTRANLPPILNGPIASSLLQYRRFQFNMIGFGIKLMKEGNYTGAGKWLLVNTIVGGFKGLMFTLLPGYFLLQGACELVGLCDEASRKDNVLFQSRRILKNNLGEEAANALMFGLPSIMGADVSGSLSLFAEPYGKTAADRVKSQLTGPSLGFFEDLYSAMTADTVQPVGYATRAYRAMKDTGPAFKWLAKNVEHLSGFEGTDYDDQGRVRTYDKDKGRGFWMQLAGGFRTVDETVWAMEFDRIMLLKEVNDSSMSKAAAMLTSGNFKGAMEETRKHNAKYPLMSYTLQDLEKRSKNIQKAKNMPAKDRRYESASKRVKAQLAMERVK